ncbi:hypothetical protein FisN_24Lh240 [Fistulifera solaris]|uniref:Uncharacterized protein n=1 Tax=Fistulifera solaris TaxID=1519565 RepID=A0A1Z5K9V9_FISSO|nr:hypothetical protein FisN_24Lh240 [Fistulifera solaris]|eukprot:GAX22945.1 hypothetical protein FisN_24Lh240 [Fistulifera solaris]
MTYISFSGLLLILCGTVIGQCPLCYDGSDPPDPDFVPGGRLDDLTCDSLAFGASVPDPEGDGPTCEDWLLIGLQCGCPIPPGGCPLCYDGSRPPSFQKEVLNSTCAIFISAAGTPNSDPQTPTCDQWLQIGVLCECPVPDDACGLCEDGSPIPDPELMIGVDKCSDLIARAAFSEGEECSSLQATAGVYCGCSNPIASEGYCRICGNGTLLPNPSFVPETDDNTERSCGQLEINREGLACDELQNLYAEACCSAAPVAAPSGNVAPTGDEAPAPVETLAPTADGAPAPVSGGVPTVSPEAPVPATPVNPSPVDSGNFTIAPAPTGTSTGSSSAVGRGYEFLTAIFTAVVMVW